MSKKQPHGLAINSNKRWYSRTDAVLPFAIAIVVLKHDLPMFIDFSHSVTLFHCGRQRRKSTNTQHTRLKYTVYIKRERKIHKDLHALKTLDDCHLNTQQRAVGYPADVATSRQTVKMLLKRTLNEHQEPGSWESEKEQQQQQYYDLWWFLYFVCTAHSLSFSLSLSGCIFLHDSLWIRFYIVALYLYNTFWHWLLCKTLFKKRSLLNVIRKIVSEWHLKFVILNESHKNAYFGLCVAGWWHIVCTTNKHYTP